MRRVGTVATFHGSIRTATVYARYLRATVDLIDEGQPITQGRLARRLGVTQQAVSWRLRRHPDWMPRITRTIEAELGQYVGIILRRIAQIAMQGSVRHARLFLAYHCPGRVPWPD